MVFRPLEIAFGLQSGFSLFSFNWDDGTFNSFLGLVWDSSVKCLYVAAFFTGWVFDFEEEEE